MYVLLSTTRQIKNHQLNLPAYILLPIMVIYSISSLTPLYFFYFFYYF